jgi:aminotransferase
VGLQLSQRHAWVMQSEIRNMSIECDRINGINLSQGVCDLEVPVEVRMGAQAAMDAGINTYTRYDGLAELREAIAHKQKVFTGMEPDPETEIIVSAGATGAFYCACLALLNPGDEVILFEPFYGYHVSTLVATQAVPVYVRMAPPDWSFSDRDLERAVSPKTRGIMINTRPILRERCSPGKNWNAWRLLQPGTTFSCLPTRFTSILSMTAGSTYRLRSYRV